EEKNLIKFGKNVIKKYNIKNLLITRSEKGMLLINSKLIKKIKADTKKVIDVTGAGDTVIATIALMLTLGLSVEDSIKISNYAAGIIIGKSGTASINYLDLIK
ncbi:PfkB family carbohydrate kinase, partial [Pelagibacterales bacterium]|nr:PfkB family carbohydrate kinase [Pelagibacterales bacterium]